MNDFRDKVALILGGTGDIGSSIAEAFEKEGIKVCRHGRAGEYAADARQESQLKELVAKVINNFGHLDILVNSLSSPVKICGFERKKWSDFLEQFDVQFKAAVVTAGLVLPEMRKQHKGKIINILTAYTVGEPPASLADYVAAKYALLGLTKALAQELAKYNITVNAVSPSIIKNRFSQGVPEKVFDLVAAQTPSGRLTTNEDVAKAVVFLASSATDQITGENIIVSGGQIMR